MTPPQPASTKFDAIKIIGQLFSYAKHLRLMLLMGAVGLLSGITYYLYATPTYEAKSLVSVQSYGTPVREREVPELAERAGVSRVFLERFRSKRVQLAAAETLGLIGENATYEDVLRVVPAVRVGMVDGRHLEITVLAFDPEVVRTFGNAMVDAFQELQEDGWREFRDEALKRYTIQVAELETKIAESIEALSKIEREQNLTELTLEQQSLMEIPKQLIQARERISRMDGVREILAQVEGQQEGARTDIQRVLTMLSLLGTFEKESAVEVGDVVSRVTPRDGIVASKGRADVVVEPANVEGLEPWRELEKQKRTLEADLQEASKTFLPDHPRMKELTAKLEETERGLLTEAKILREKFDLEYARLQEKVVLLTNRMPEYQKASEELGKSAFAYSAVADTQKMWDKARESLTEKLSSIAFNEDFDWVQLRFKEHLSLRDDVPISPNKAKLAILSLIIGIAGAVGVPTFLNLFDTSASTVQQLEDLTGLNGIGIVPLTSQEFLEEVHRSPAQGATIPNFLLECFRVIRSNICLHPDHRKKSQVVLVTSSRPQEGKTTQAANLAWAFYSMGERTLLLDCDLRRGRVHGLMKQPNEPGMTRLLLGECNPQEAILKTGLEGFDLIPRGPVIAGTTEILCQERFEELLELFRKHYDRIVIDSPPVLGLSESSSLQRVVDGTVLVVRAESTARKDVLDAVTLLRKSDAHFFGFVLNAVDLSKAANYYNYYYYSAPYYDQFEPEAEPEQMKATVRRQSLVSNTQK